MVDVHQLDRTYHFILQTLVERGQAPHFTEIARAFTVSPEEGKRLLHELMATGLPNWVFPQTDLIASFAPFNNLPTQYRIAVDGQEKWFGQGGLESLAVCWLFPGRAVVIEAPCLDCGEPLRVTVREGIIEGQEPTGIYGYSDLPFREWRSNWPYAGSRMNLFRSEEHARNWSDFKAEAEAGLLSLTDMMAIMSTPRHRERLNGHYISSMASYGPQFFERLKEITHNNPFWDPGLR